MTQFDFYLINKSFEYQETVSLGHLRERIEQMASDCTFIKEKEESIFRHSSIYEVNIFNDVKLIDVLCYQDYAELGHDQFFFLQQIIDQCKDTTLENEEIIELLDEHDPDVISGLLCLHEINDVSPNYCVYTQNDWFRFHRYFLTVYVPEVKDFCNDVNPYFPNLHFNTPSVVSSIRSLHTSHKEIITTVIHHLSAINDDFCYFFNQEGVSGDGACDELENHYRGHEVKIGASRDKNGCDDLKFSVQDDEGNTKNLYCDLHTKFYQYFEYRNPSYQAKGNRIYFHQPMEGFADGKVIIAHVGKHLCS
jgi:hypothetical protein